MASEYLKWKARDVQKDEPPPERSRKDKFKNWLYYHKWWLIAGAVLLWIVVSMIWGIFGIGQTRPDYVFACVCGRSIDEKAVTALEEAIAAYGEDVNGDGKVAVKINVYRTNVSNDLETQLYYGYASDTRLLADITKADSYFFLTDDPAGMQNAWQIIADKDGNPPKTEEPLHGIGELTGRVYLFENCPKLASADEEKNFSGLYLGRRCFYGEEAKGHEASDLLWRLLIGGAKND